MVNLPSLKNVDLGCMCSSTPGWDFQQHELLASIAGLRDLEFVSIDEAAKFFIV